MSGIKKNILKLCTGAALFSMIFSVNISAINTEEVFNSFSIDKTIAKDNYLKLSEENRGVVDKYIIDDINNVYKQFNENDITLAEAYMILNNYDEVNSTFNVLEKIKNEITIISESKNNYMKAKKEENKDVNYATLENAISYYEGIDPISEYYHESQEKIELLSSTLLELSKNNKIPNIEDENLLEYFKYINPDRIIREYNLGIIKEKYIYDNDKYLIFENDKIVDSGIN